MPASTNTIRLSVALPRKLVEEAMSSAPPGLHGNLNRLVLLSLADPAIRSECEAISAKFKSTSSI